LVSLRNVESEEQARVSSGRLFHARAPATGKERSPRVARRVDGTCNCGMRDCMCLQCRCTETGTCAWRHRTLDRGPTFSCRSAPRSRRRCCYWPPVPTTSAPCRSTPAPYECVSTSVRGRLVSSLSPGSCSMTCSGIECD